LREKVNQINKEDQEKMIKI